MAKLMAVQRGIPSRVIYDALGVSNQLLSQWIHNDIVRRGDVRTCGAFWSYDMLDIKTIKGLRNSLPIVWIDLDDVTVEIQTR